MKSFLRILPYLAASILLTPIVRAGGDEIAITHNLTLAGARKVLAAAEAYADHVGAAGAIAIVDNGGHVLLLVRRDGTFLGSPEISIGKARTAVEFKKPTRDFEEIIAKGRFAMTSLPNFTPLQGGVPIFHDGKIVGAIGVSGAKSAPQDEEIANAGAAAFAADL